MTDHAFLVELHIRAYMDQVDGYPLGHPSREKFKPIVAMFHDKDGKIDRARTLENSFHNFSTGDVALLMNTTEDWRDALNECRQQGVDV